MTDITLTIEDLSLSKYPMKNDGISTVGRAMIFNNTEFDDEDLDDRTGSRKDADDMKNVLEQFGFEVEDIYENKRNIEAQQILESVTSNKTNCLQPYDCFLGVFLSHGENDKIQMRDGVLHIQDNILQQFRKCKAMAGKPKIFIIQACRGVRRDKEMKIRPKENPVPSEDGQAPKVEIEEEVGVQTTTPAGADFLVCYPTAYGCVSYRDQATGSWFIQTIVKVLETYHNDKSDTEIDLVSLMTKVAELVAKKRTGNFPNGVQIPCIVSTLKKQLFLPKKDKMCQ